jgi:hypothetical protein
LAASRVGSKAARTAVQRAGCWVALSAAYWAALRAEQRADLRVGRLVVWTAEKSAAQSAVKMAAWKAVPLADWTAGPKAGRSADSLDHLLAAKSAASWADHWVAPTAALMAAGTAAQTVD